MHAHRKVDYMAKHNLQMISSFSANTIDGVVESLKQKRRHGSQTNIRKTTYTVSPVGVLDSILWPKTYIGFAILCACIKNDQVLIQMRENGSIRVKLLKIVERCINYFPAYLINTDITVNCYIKRRWGTWIKIDKDIDTIFSKNIQNQEKVGLVPSRKRNGRFSKTSVKRPRNTI